MNLYILRHGLAEDRKAWAPRDDRKRPLTKEGLKKTRRIAEGMAHLGLSFDRILSSPLTRAWQTAEIVVENVGGKKKLEVCPALAPSGSMKALIQQLGEHGDWEDVLIVGHEPYLTQLASLLLMGLTDAGLILKKGGLCKLTLSQPNLGKCAWLEWWLPPKVLAALA